MELMMTIIYMAASIIGGAAAAALVGQSGLALALLAAPIGGSLSALATAQLVNTSTASRQGVPPEIVWC